MARRRKKRNEIPLAKRKANTNSKYWKDKCDETWADVVKIRDGNKCVICGDTVRVNAHHHVCRSHLPTRYLIDNGITLCPLHHQFDRDMSAHKSPLRFYYWFMNNYPVQARKLVDLKFVKVKDKEKRKFNYKEKLAELEACLDSMLPKRTKLKPRK